MNAHTVEYIAIALFGLAVLLTLLWVSISTHPDRVAKMSLFIAVLGLFVSVGATIVGHEDSSGGGGGKGPTSTPTVAAGSSQVGSAPLAQPIRLSNLPYQEPAVISVTGTGDLSQREHLWIFVYASGTGRYFPQGKVDSPNPNPWMVPGVNVGSSGTEDNGHIFTIYALVVDDSTSAEIYSFARANPDLGYSKDDWQATFMQFVVDSVQVQRV